MKQRIFTLIALAAMVLIGGNAMAQSTARDAYVGATHNYAVGSLDDQDVWTFIVTLQTENLQNGDSPTPVDGTEFDFVTTNSGTVVAATSTSADVDIKWNTAGTYRVWIEVKDEGATGCSNYRFVKVTVTDNNFNVVIVSLGSGDENDTDVSAFTAKTTDCPAFVDEQFDDDLTDTEGSTYVFFKVTRTVTAASTADWKFTPTIGGTATVTTWESSVDGANWATVTTIGNQFTVSDATGTEDNVWFRAKVTNATEATPDLTFNFGATAVEVAGTGTIADQDDSGSNTATLTLNALPAIGDFTLN